MGQPFVEVILEGPRGRARGFAEGYLAGRGIEAGLLDAEEEGFEREALRERLSEIRPRSEVLHLLVPEQAAGAVREAAEIATSRGMVLVVRDTRAIAGASFEFSFTAFSPAIGRRVLSLLSELPEGVRVHRDRPDDERIDPSARGVEAYSPVHEYEIRGQGRVEGDFEGVLAVHRRLREEDEVRLGRAKLIPAEP